MYFQHCKLSLMSLYYLQISRCGETRLQEVNGKFNNVHTFPAAAALSAMCLKNHQSQNQWNKLLKRFNTYALLLRDQILLEGLEVR